MCRSSECSIWQLSFAETLYGFVIEQGLLALDHILEEDRERLCGPVKAKGRSGAPVRWGHPDARLSMGGRRVVVSRPRVRQEGKEVKLPTWQEFADDDPLNERTVEQPVLCVSTRDYQRSVEESSDELGPHGASKSAAYRRFVAVAAERLEKWSRRGLSDMGLVTIMLHGIEVDEQRVIAALGFDESGTKHPLGDGRRLLLQPSGPRTKCDLGSPRRSGPAPAARGAKRSRMLRSDC